MAEFYGLKSEILKHWYLSFYKSSAGKNFRSNNKNIFEIYVQTTVMDNLDGSELNQDTSSAWSMVIKKLNT